MLYLPQIRGNRIFIMMHIMVENMTLMPIQTNSNKCAFGYFYHALNVTHPDIMKEWKEIDQLHHTFHAKDDEIIRDINNLIPIVQGNFSCILKSNIKY
jgi:hypothetical protein